MAVVTNVSTYQELVDAIAAINSDGSSDAQTIVLTADITLEGSIPTIEGNGRTITLKSADGALYTIDGLGLYSSFIIENANLVTDDLSFLNVVGPAITIRGNSSYTNGGSLTVKAGDGDEVEEITPVIEKEDETETPTPPDIPTPPTIEIPVINTPEVQQSSLIVGVTITGTKKNDVIDGSKSVNGQPTATEGDDTILGLGGNDKLGGEGGDDTINGGKKRDKLTGGDGDDAFIFDVKLKNKWADKITDFEVGSDSIHLGSDIFEGVGLFGTLKDEFFAAGKKASSDDAQVLYHAKSGWLRFDEDGKGGDKAIKFAKVDKNLDLSADDFLVI